MTPLEKAEWTLIELKRRVGEIRSRAQEDAGSRAVFDLADEALGQASLLFNAVLEAAACEAERETERLDEEEWLAPHRAKIARRIRALKL